MDTPDPNDHPRLSREDRLRLIELAADLGERSADRLWSRHQILLTVQGGLLAIAAYGIGHRARALVEMLGIIGIAVSFVWLKIHEFSQFAEARWRADLSQLIDDDDEIANALRSRSSMGPRIRRPKRSATAWATVVIWITGLMWLCLSVGSFVKWGLIQPASAP